MSDSASISSTSCSPEKKRKKGVINRHKYKQFVIREDKLHGRAHVNYAGKEVPPRKTGDDCK